MKQRSLSSIALLACAVLGALSAGCTSVKAYQRGKLAHPTMALDEPTGVAEAHVYGVHEGATGGAGGVGGGCGCN
ncbi:MAG: DUF4266 domain-containing protein [Myxococcales bacterium]|nr:DUF4266 domain-containing protein [Myxococcales bacterium]